MRHKIIIIMLVLPMLAFAQKVGDIGYLKARGIGSSILLCQKARNSLGSLVAGKTIAKLPGGTIVKGKYGGNGYWLTVDHEPEAVISMVCDVKQKFVDPARLVGMNFHIETYATDYPALGDKPVSARVISISEKRQLPDNRGDVIVRFTDISNPESANATNKVTEYYGVFEPYRLKLVSAEGKVMPYIYVNGSDSDYIEDKVYGLYYDGNHYNILGQ